MPYYIMKGKQCFKYGGWNDANLSCEASDPISAGQMFDSVFKKDAESGSVHVTSMVEVESQRNRGGLEPE